jgi:hypothetical protein
MSGGAMCGANLDQSPAPAAFQAAYAAGAGAEVDNLDLYSGFAILGAVNQHDAFLVRRNEQCCFQQNDAYSGTHDQAGYGDQLSPPPINASFAKD